jgi:hypothetical protein
MRSDHDGDCVIEVVLRNGRILRLSEGAAPKRVAPLAAGGMRIMIPVPTATQIWVACGATDMRRGFDGLAVMVQEVIKKDPYSGHLFAFRGKRADRIKILWWDGTGLCLYSKRLALLIRQSRGPPSHARSHCGRRLTPDVYRATGARAEAK